MQKQKFNLRKLCFVLMLFVIHGAMAQNKTVKGVVLDNERDPLIGVTVAVPGNPSMGAVTDIDGKFSLSVPDGIKTLVFSYIGYQTQEVNIAGRSYFDVIMQSDQKLLDEVVVIGYGSMKRSDLTGSVSQLSSENFKSGNNLTAQNMMQGAFAGVNVAQNSGKPGASNTIRVRGGTSITASNDPLYVIDGVPIDANAGVGQSSISTYNHDNFDKEAVNPLDALNPNDIESINVLKDASATAIYGSRGANGVIIITTKQGKKGTQQLDYGYSIGFSNSAGKLDVLNANEYREAVKKLGRPLDDKGQNMDWQDEIFRTAISQQHYASFMHGGEYPKGLRWYTPHLPYW